MSLATPLLGIGEKGAITDEGAGAAGAGMCMSTSLCLCDACCLRYAHVQGVLATSCAPNGPYLRGTSYICIQHPCSSKPILISVPCKDCGVSSSRQATAAGQRDKKNAWPPHDCRAEIYDFPAYAGFRSQLRVSSYDKLLLSTSCSAHTPTYSTDFDYIRTFTV